MELSTFICYSHDFAFGLVKTKLPQLCPVIESIEICLEIITVFRVCDDHKNCTVIREETNRRAQTSIKMVNIHKEEKGPKNGPLWDP